MLARKRARSIGENMNFWQKNIAQAADEGRAERIIQKKRRKQDPKAKGLGAVTIPRKGPRAIHQRNEDRHVLRGRNAKADIGGAIHDTELLNLSSNGVMISCEEEVAIGEQVYLSIEDCAPITTAVRWVRAGRIGLEFIAETVIIAEAGVQDFIVKTIRREAEASGAVSSLKIGTERCDVAQRHQLVFVAKLRQDDHEVTARLRNISRSGAMIAISDQVNLSRGDNVTLSLANCGDIPATVKWISDRQYGLAFDEDFDVSLLVNESCAELAPPDDARGLGGSRQAENVIDDDVDSLNVRLGKVQNPHQAPEMEYQRLTLDEVYATLYPNGRPEEQPPETAGEEADSQHAGEVPDEGRGQED